MKVFLSWSGSRSHKVALVFRDWLPSVIQQIVPYVSSEDIDKGARWSTDIAKELSDSTFGILCVTRDNLNAPWLTFEAGALSKTMDKTFVSPFLFDIRRSEVDGPMLQFQSTIFEKSDLKKLVETINKACEKDGLAPDRLNETFDVWYPSLESRLNELKDTQAGGRDIERATELQAPKVQEILEEVLELARMNQKLLRSPELTTGVDFENMNRLVNVLVERTEKADVARSAPRRARSSSAVLRDALDASVFSGGGYVQVRTALGLIRHEYPWIYDVGIETINILQSPSRKIGEKREAMHQFGRVVDFLTSHPLMREMHRGRDDIYYVVSAIQGMLVEALERNGKR